MANVDIIIRMIDQTGMASNKTIANLKSMAGTLASVTAAAVAVGYAIKKTFDIAKEGAVLEYTAAKFDRLTESIGTTSDALLNDLRKATGGIYSDMELMASATDFVGLGLAKTHDEAVRLANVSGGLNMNMNQLVLTLTNMTTMRFDALGVRVDGFKEKVEALEKQGYSTNDAFKEAFLQQAEEQLKLVGHAADETVGSYMRLEAAFKNMADESKKNFAAGLEPLVLWMAEATEKTNRFRETLQKIDPELYRQYQKSGLVSLEMKNLVDEYQRAEQYGLAWEKALRQTSEATGDAVIMTEEMIEAMSKTNEEFLSLVGNMQSAEERYQDKANSLVEKRLELEAEKNTLLSQGWSEQSEKILDINRQLEENSEAAQANADEHELANRRIILGLLERKLTADGILDDKELQWLLEKGVAWGIYSDTVIAETQRAVDEANSLINGLETEKTFVMNFVAQGLETIRNVGTYWAGEKRATGGPVSAGQPYLVGERGMEIFTPQQSGYITPNNRIETGGSDKRTLQLLEVIASNRIDYDALSRAFMMALQQGLK